jgi:hypothetical protein
MTADDINTIVFVKQNKDNEPVEHYIFIDNEENPKAVLETLRRFASDKELSFTWHDAAVLSQKIRREAMDDDTPE